MATDGWKKKAAKQLSSQSWGKPLVNTMALKPACCAVYLDIVWPGDASTIAEWIADTHEELLRKAVEGGDESDLPADWADHVLGVDNAPSNSGAMNLLTERHPSSVLVGCTAHASNLLSNDLAYKKVQSRGQLGQQASYKSCPDGRARLLFHDSLGSVTQGEGEVEFKHTRQRGGLCCTL
eukprot:354547-Chlamydomonas_euryale.AAC.3